MTTKRKTMCYTLLLGCTAFAIYAAPPVESEPKSDTVKIGRAVTPDPIIAKLEACQADLVEAKKEIAALTRRLRAIDVERQDAQTKNVLLRDDNLRLSEELEAAKRDKQ